MLTARLASFGDPEEPVTADNRKFAEQATRIINEIVSTDEFFTEVRNSTYSWPFWLAPDNTLRPKRPEEIADIIAAGTGSSTSSIDLVIKLADLPEKARAKTFPRESETQTDTDFFEQCRKDNNPGELAAVWMHEWMHTIGFLHKTAIGDQFDVPYTIERIVRELSARTSIAPVRPDGSRTPDQRTAEYEPGSTEKAEAAAESQLSS